jgi:ribosome-binding protein aMBF1 (putative translation factor)
VVSDARAQQAREHHRAAIELLGDAARHRHQRDELVRALRKSGWTYKSLAKAVGCSPELIAVIVRNQSS